ncbi:MAG: GntR family transcriptional regulator [Comamonadaceae bacterium]|nr:MAG: GntR family transcriptional regulator [Comamonadaceae bacterium]
MDSTLPPFPDDEDFPALQGPRHQSLTRTLAAEIRSGMYPVGSKLPRELDLCKQFGASRHTVRLALDRLTRAGLIKRTPRLGTLVLATQAQRAYQLTVSQISDLMQHSADTRMKVLSRSLETVDADAEPALKPYEGQQWLFVTGLRYVGDQPAPISWHEVWVHPDYRAVQGVQGHITHPIFHLVERQFNVVVARVRQTIRSATLPPDIAAQLEVQTTTACLWVRREYYDAQDRMIELSLSVHPGNLFSYEMVLERSTPSGGSD